MELNTNQSVVAVTVVGYGYSIATEKVARESNIPVISSTSTSIVLSDPSIYANLFRTVPSDEPLAPALVTVMQYFGWRQISIVTEKEPQFTEFLKLLQRAFSGTYIMIDIPVQFTAGNLSETADVVFGSKSRIIFLNMNPRSAIFYLCRGFHEKWYYPAYIWITFGWYQQEWWKSEEDYVLSLNCNFSNIEQQLNRSLVLLANPNTGFLNTTEPYNQEAYAADAVMALALALNKSYSEDPSLNLSASLHGALETVVFSGASGTVKFDVHGNRQDTVVLLRQFRMHPSGFTLSHTIAMILEGTVMLLNGETNSSIWPDVAGEIPPIVTVFTVVIPPVYAYLATLVTVGLVLCFVCFLFNIIFRERKVVKLTSPKLNYVIVFGAVLLLIGSLLSPLPSRNVTLISIICPAARILQSTGYDICFVVALVKTIRVAYIFRTTTPNKKNLRDWHLLLLSASIISIEVIYSIPLLILTYVMGDGSIVEDDEYSTFKNDEGYTVTHVYFSCGISPIFIVYLALVMTYKVIIHVIGLVLAFLTRKVKIDPLNDSKYSAAIIYSSCIMLFLAVVLIVSLNRQNLYAGMWTSLVFVQVCVFLGLAFIPKMVSLYRDPHGEKVFEPPKSQSQTENRKSIHNVIDCKSAESKE